MVSGDDPSISPGEMRVCHATNKGQWELGLTGRGGIFRNSARTGLGWPRGCPGRFPGPAHVHLFLGSPDLELRAHSLGFENLDTHPPGGRGSKASHEKAVW